MKQTPGAVRIDKWLWGDRGGRSRGPFRGWDPEAGCGVPKRDRWAIERLRRGE
jgi:hypothetical protein